MLTDDKHDEFIQDLDKILPGGKHGDCDWFEVNAIYDLTDVWASVSMLKGE